MRITQADNGRNGATSQPAGRKFRLSAWYAQLFLLVVAFAAGAVVYRSGIIRPVTLFVRQLITLGVRQADWPQPVDEAIASVEDEVRMYVNNGLPTLYMDIQFEDYQKLLDKRAEALDIGILNTTDADEVSAEVQLGDGEKLNAKVRLKGDWTDHLQGDKWSFRINLKEKGEVLHMRQFSIQSPETRNYLYEWAFHNNLLNEGLLTPRFTFVNVLLNGKLLGIYALEENFAPELIESQGRRQGVIIRFDEDLLWQNRTVFWEQDVIADGGLMVNNRWTSDITTFQPNKIAENPTLAAEAETARNLLRAYQTGELPASEVFDVQLMGRYFALADIWAVCHGAYWHNLRFYYNPVTALLEPVPFDSEPFRWCDMGRSNMEKFIETSLFDDPDIRTAYARELSRLTQAGYLDELHDQLMDAEEGLKNALLVEFPGEAVDVDWAALVERSNMLSLELQPAQPARGAYQAHGVVAGSTESPSLDLELLNMTLLPVEVLGLEVNGQDVSFETPVQLPALDQINEPDTETVKTSIALEGTMGLEVEAPDVKALVRLVGFEKITRVPLSGTSMPESAAMRATPQQPALEEVLLRHAFLSQSSTLPQTLVAAAGVWNVRGDLVLPAGMNLIVPAGTTLLFEPRAVLYATGSLSLLGEENAPVIITAQEETWGGLVVSKADGDSKWQFAVVDKTGGIAREGWILTGGITFYQSDVFLDHVLLGNNQTEDAINVIHSNFSFRNSEFAHTFADSFDSDFSDGEIVNCYFHDITGDAVDFSGSVVQVTGSRMERITDKGVSVGEKSTVTVSDTTMDTVGIGVASKDLSVTRVENVEIRSARFSAFAAYIKKPVYGPASIEALNVTILDTATAAVAQLGSTIVINGETVIAEDLDVETLYAEGILGN